MQVAAYGVALQTRRVRALDIDVSDPPKAAAAAVTFEKVLGMTLPRRGRANSGKVLLPFIMSEPLRKRSFKCDGGLVELLGDGQQFIFQSMHTSGVPYEWLGGLPKSIPEISAALLDEAWQVLEREYSIEPRKHRNRQQGVSPQRRNRAPAEQDTRYNWLLGNWPNYGVGHSGHLNIECPFSDGHSLNSGESECAYLPGGTNGYSRGHYKCLHASCANYTQAQFDEATGYARVFEHEARLIQWPAEIERDEGGKIRSSLSNLVVALQVHELVGGSLAFDDFLGDIFLRLQSGGPAIAFSDDQRSLLRLRLEQAGFRRIITSDLREASRIVALNNHYDSARDWLLKLQWDGVPRIDKFLTTYFNVTDGPYPRAVSLYLWTALAGRVLVPGCQADMVPILVSPEGRHKSRSLQAIAPRFDQFAEIDLQHRDADLSRLIKGKLIGELAELRGLRLRNVEAIKAFVTSRCEVWTPKYMESVTRYDRRIVMVGTTNEEQFLGPLTGDRRWLPIRIEDGKPGLIERDRDQLWAQAASVVQLQIVFDEDPVIWRPASELGAKEREPFKLEDIYETRILAWVEEGTGITAIEGFSTESALVAAGVQNRAAPGEQQKVAQALRRLGFVQKRPRGESRRSRLWTRALPTDSDETVNGTTGPLEK